ncbi:MAG: hypothetical protein WEC58_01875, partial [Candidatus Paceibacterota bacterium]
IFSDGQTKAPYFTASSTSATSTFAGNVVIGSSNENLGTGAESLFVSGSMAGGSGSVASGANSFAFGFNATASGGRSTASGYTTTASGGYSTAFGHTSTASGFASTASGYGSQAQNVGSYAFGGQGWAGNGSGGPTASANGAFAFGEDFTNSTASSFAVGFGQIDLFVNDGKVGIGTTSPSTALDVAGVITATGGNSTQWNTAFGWGDHSLVGYLDGVTATGLEVSGTDVALSSGYTIPLSASTTNWEAFRDTPSTRISAGTGLTWSTNTLNVDDVETLSTSLSEGSVVFSDGTNLTEDNSNFFWDDSTNRLGIGTSSPKTSLHINEGPASSAPYSQIYLEAPEDQDAAVTLQSARGGTNNAWYFGAGAGNPYFNNNFRIVSLGPDSGGPIVDVVNIDTDYNFGIGTRTPSAKLDVTNSSSSLPIQLWSNSSEVEKARITDSGYFGLGTANPSALLSVEGQAKADYFTASSTSATSTFAGNVVIGSSDESLGTGNESLFVSGSMAGGSGSVASGNNSLAYGNGATASGHYSVAFGYNTEVSGSYSAAFGEGTTASASYSIAFGEDIEASGAYAFAVALDQNQFGVQVPANTAAFMGGKVGIGTTSPSTALDVSGVITATGGNSTQWNTAFGWGDHSLVGYLEGVTATGLEVSGTDVALSSGYTIPLTASTTNWESFYQTPSTRITAGTGLSWTGNTLNSTSTEGSGIWAIASNLVSNTGTNSDVTADDFVFGSTQLADTGNADHDNRFFFDKSKGAFRAGYVTGSEWDDSNVGIYSTAIGRGAIASGAGSFAGGYMGAYGGNINSTNSGSFAFGSVNSYLGNQATIESTGNGAVAMGYAQTSSGNSTISSSGLGSIALGRAGSGGRTLQASGSGAVAMGYANAADLTATGDGSVALGEDIRATADNAFALGRGFENSTADSFVVGFGSEQLTLDGSTGNLSIAGTTTASGFYADTTGIKFPDGTLQTTAATAGASAASSSGAIQYSDGSGGFLADADNFFWDDSTNRLGIGTNNPS